MTVFRTRSAWLALVLALGLAPTLLAQIARGTVYGRITDDSGGVLPGATVTLTGELGTRSTVTDPGGEFRFLNVDQGNHSLVASLTGFATLTRPVTVRTGENVNIPVALKVASVQESVVVEGETPVVDPKRVGTATVVTKDELAGIPSSRDPWALMRTVPGVLVDRVNVAGAESGQQSNFVGKGADAKDSTWSLDGVVITDMSAIGASPTYFTYDSFDEIAFATGGADLRSATGGIGINMVTKRGTNSFRGSVGGYFTHDDLQWSNLPDELAGDPRLLGNDKADHTQQIADYSAELGGPILKDKLWFYASYGKNDIRIVNLRQRPDKTVLKNFLGKLNWQPTTKDMVSVFWFNGEKTKIGRAGSAPGLANTENTFWNQGNAYPGQPHGLTKVEWNRTFSSSFFASLKGSYYSTGFTLVPDTTDGVFYIDNELGVGRGTADERRFERPAYTVNLDGNYFVSGTGGSHEIKFGGGWRRTDAESLRVHPGDRLRAVLNPDGTRQVQYWRDTLQGGITEYWSAYLGDTFTRGRLTLSAGLRFDRQSAKNKSTSVDAHPLEPGLLPALTYPGSDGFNWTDVSPRIGATLALDDARKTILRASFARYAGQVSLTDATWDNPLGTTYAEYEWNDTNGDRLFSLDERGAFRRFSPGYDPSGTAVSANEIDPDFHSNKDNEVVVGIDHELAPNLAVSAAYTWRRSTDFTASQLLSGYYWYNWIGVSRNDYVAGEGVTSHGYTAFPYYLSDAGLDRATGGLLLSNRPDFSRTFNGVELALVKRLSNRWMGRLAFGWNDWKDSVGPGAVVDPTPLNLDPQIDGGTAVYFGGASGKNYYVDAGWQLNANALYQLPWDIEIAGNVFGRQGYPAPVFITVDTGGLIGPQAVLAGRIDDRRLKDLWNVDLRLAKNLRIGPTRVALSAEVFNLLNAGTELYRFGDAGSLDFDRLDEILAPRIVRFGARFTF